MPIEIDDTASAALDTLAAARSTTSKSLAREAIDRFLTHEAWFEAQVHEGLGAAARGDLVDHADIVREIEAMLDALRA